MENLIIIDEFRHLGRPMSEHIEAQRLLVCIDEAERLDVMPTIGDTFYLDLVKNKYDEQYKILLDGGEYEDACGNIHLLKGLKSAIAYYAYARLIRLADNEVTRFGFVAKNDDYSERLSTKDKLTAYTDARIVADGYMREVKDYLGQPNCACGKKYRNKVFKYGRTRFNVIGE